MFYRGVAPGEIEGMDYHQLKYWNGWHETLVNQEAAEAERVKKSMNR